MKDHRILSSATALAALALLLTALPATALAQESTYPKNMGNPGDQLPPGERGTDNIEVVGHLPLGGFLHTADIEMEQELDRPFVYVSKRFRPTGVEMISIEDPGDPEVVYSWRIENADLHTGAGSVDGKYFKLDDRYYYVQAVQFGAGGPDTDLGAIVFDVTGLPDGSTVEEVGRIRAPETPGGFHNIYVYHHSDGRVLLFTTTTSSHANVYDMRKFVEDDGDPLVAQIDLPKNPYWGLRGGTGTWHDFYVGYHPPSGEDRFYGGGVGGYFVFDITDLQNPRRLATLTGISGVNWGHTITPTPDGRFVVTETEYQYAPLRIFDLQPALEGDREVISQSVSAWTADWRNLSHNHEMRWPFVFVASYEDGFQVFDMTDPTQPRTWAYYDTYQGPHYAREQGNVNMGAWGVDVRDEDGLIAVSDMYTGLWLFRMEGFGGWDGDDWNMPDVSSAQDWDTPPGSEQ